MNARITATAQSTPDNVMTNFDLEKLLSSNEWIQSRTGMVQRHVVTDDEASSYFSPNSDH